ncbi:MAG: hypothetical protein HYZ44_02830 [Bacteroidetes bacterium]|nr:hypothetical protein [Bacteroidota bacterium]
MAATKFRVVIDVPLTAKQQKELNKDLQAVANRHIAKIDNKAILGTRFPKEWMGIWIKRFATIEALKKSSFKSFR